MKLVYLCGGINALSDAECTTWRERCKQLLGEDQCLDPMRRDYRGKEDQHVEEIVRGDLEDIDNSAILLVNATRPSWGTAMEVFYAATAGKRVVAFVGDARVSPWLRHHSSLVVASVDDAVAACRVLVEVGE